MFHSKSNFIQINVTTGCMQFIKLPFLTTYSSLTSHAYYMKYYSERSSARSAAWNNFIILLHAKHAHSLLTVPGLSQLRNSRLHKSLSEYMLGIRQWCHGAFCISRQHRLHRRWPLKQSLPSVNHEQFPMQMAPSEKTTKWLQILAQEDFPPKLLWCENADFKFSVNNEGEDVNKKPRNRRNIAYHSEGNADNKRQRNRRLESEALWSFYTVENTDFLVCWFPRRYIDQSL